MFVNILHEYTDDTLGHVFLTDIFIILIYIHI